jgi:glycosyltransferase involved in cell wall biosynthesis
MLDTQFSGRIFQVVDALSYGDAVSNQIMALDDLFRAKGLNAQVVTIWHEQRVEHRRVGIDQFNPSDKDIIIHHYCGYSDQTIPKVVDTYATRIMCYHNITPHHFFDEASPNYQFCKKGREQLKDLVGKFHFFWGDSQFNLDELIELGANPDCCDVVPIIIAPPALPVSEGRVPSTWLFVSRVAPNKGQTDLIRLFARARAVDPNGAAHLYIVGGLLDGEPYTEAVRQAIVDHGLASVVTLTGKISDEEREAYFARASLYVSMSQHEGFGVPLIEASLRGLPVFALDTTAIGETMGHGEGLAKDPDALLQLVTRAGRDDRWLQQVTAVQRANATRFAPARVERSLQAAMARFLPAANQWRTVSVVVCTYNRRDYLQRLLDYLPFQTCPRFEVVIVDGPSNDGTRQLLERYKGRIKIAFNEERNLSKSRNLGIELAAGDIVAFIDDDAIPFDDWIETILKSYNERPLITVGIGGPAYYSGTLKFQSCDIAFNELAEAKVNVESSEIGRNGFVRSLLGTNATFTRCSLFQIGGFDEQYDYFLDESDVCFRIQKSGKLISHDSNLFLRHEFAQSENRLSKFNFNWFSIYKNSTYFISSFGGMKGDGLKNYLTSRFQTERIDIFDAAVAVGELSQQDRDHYVAEIRRGMRQGLADARHFPRTRTLVDAAVPFLPFDASAARLRVGHELKRLHICIVSKEFPPFAGRGGIGTLYYHLASELLLLGHEVSVIVPGRQASELQQGRFRIVEVPTFEAALDGLDPGFASNVNASMAAMEALADLHARHPVDIVEAALWDTEALSIAMLPHAQRPPVVVRLVTPFPLAAKLNGWQVPDAVAFNYCGAEQALIAAADAVVPISEAIESSICDAYGLSPDKRWTRIYCGIAYWPSFDAWSDYAAIKELANVPQEALETGRMVLFLGRLEQRKGIDLVLSAANSFLAEMSDAHLVIAGRDVENWRERAGELQTPAAARRTHFVGEVPDSTREKLLARANCLVFPSRYESFGLVPLEAFVHGVPVIAAQAGAIPEVVTDGVNGLLFPSDDASALGRQVRSVLTDGALRQRLSDGARQRVRELSSRNMALKSLDLYQQLV